MNENSMSKLYETIKEYTVANDKYSKNRSAWFYNILIAAAGLLGALIALSNNSQEHLYVRSLFVLTVALIALGILSGAIALRYDTVCSKRHRQVVRNRIKDMSDGKVHDDLYTSIKDASEFLIFDKVTYILFSLSFICLMTYVVAKNLPELFV